MIRGVKGAALVSTDHYRAAEKVLKDVPGAVVVFDSLSAMVPPSTAQNGVNESGDRASSYRMAGQFCSMLQSVVPANGSVFIGIAHQYNNTGGGQAVWKEKMPNSFKYQATTHLQVKWGERWRTGGKGDEAKGPQIGIIPHVFVKTASHAIPGAEFPLYIRYGVGIDKTYELIQLGVELGLVEQAGAWFGLPFVDPSENEGKPVKTQGVEKLYRALEERPEWAEALAAKIREASA
jgi:recombination protein RecA